MIATMLLCAAMMAASTRPEPPAARAFDAPAFQRATGWLAADGASTVDLLDGRSLWLFGDTLVGALKDDGGCAPGTKMVNNTLGVQKIGVAAAGEMDFVWGVRAGEPASWVKSPAGGAGEHWLWPCGGGVRLRDDGGDRLVLFFMMMRRRTEGSTTDVWNFAMHGTAVVTVSNPGDAPGAWRADTGVLRDLAPALDAQQRVRLIGWGATVIDDPDDASRVMIYGIDVSQVRDKRLMLARAPRRTLAQFETWSFRTADGWSAREDDGVSIAARAVDEFSVHRQRIGERDRYVLTQTEPNLGARALVRLADRPEGPWSDGVAVYTCPEPASDKRLMVYSAKAHPELRAAEDDADDLVISYCCNSTDFWYMMGKPSLYRPKLFRLSPEQLESR